MRGHKGDEKADEIRGGAHPPSGHRPLHPAERDGDRHRRIPERNAGGAGGQGGEEPSGEEGPS